MFIAAKKSPKVSDTNVKTKPAARKTRKTVSTKISPANKYESAYLKTSANNADAVSTDRTMSGHDSTNSAPALSSHSASHFNYDKY